MLKIYQKRKKKEEAGGEAQLGAYVKEALSSVPVREGWRRGYLHSQHLQVEVQESQVPCHSWDTGFEASLRYLRLCLKKQEPKCHTRISQEKDEQRIWDAGHKSHERSHIGIGTNFIHIQRIGNLGMETELHLLQAPYEHLPTEPSFEPLEIV